ncbi:hypothetical protein [Magnetospirillum aberrantis]|uniref:Uncharacterized protein n=1 Tax=Magnetospirillum aberrantis SpK TaxID=908842 RepID=A0A7C9QRT4_9PROT|nr:hypothetical protein [Magnetospirillum aberrantis]NFV79058.1 hypothetical protein [Magnetospirillum aberrantis SpK]
MSPPPAGGNSNRGNTMIIDTEDPATLAQANPLERQVLRDLSDRLAMQAWQRRGWGYETKTDGSQTPEEKPS